MARMNLTGDSTTNKAGAFFFATLALWLMSVSFEILYNERRQLLWIVVGCCFYQAANWVIRISVSRDSLFVNTSVSLLHSTVTSATVIFILASQFVKVGLNQMIEHAELVGNPWLCAYPAICLSCGYFAYDQLDMLKYRLYRGTIPFILVHHLILLICFSLALYRNVTINYLTLTLGCELHSIFLHLRKLRRMAGFRDSSSKLVKIEWAINWGTFVIARIMSHIFITIKLIADSSKFDGGVTLPLALFGMVGMNLLNIGLGKDLLHAFRKDLNLSRSSHRHDE